MMTCARAINTVSVCGIRVWHIYSALTLECTGIYVKYPLWTKYLVNLLLIVTDETIQCDHWDTSHTTLPLPPPEIIKIMFRI